MITEGKFRKLAIGPRLAIGGALAEKVLAFYSDNFRRRYLQAEDLDFLWTCIASDRYPRAEIKRRLKAASALFDRAEREGYSFYEASLVASLLEECETKSGKGIAACIDYVGIAYLKLFCYRYNIDPTDPRVTNSGLRDKAELIGHGIAEGLYSQVKNIPLAELRAFCLDRVQIPCVDNTQALSKSILAVLKKPTTGYQPPPPEQRPRRLRR